MSLSKISILVGIITFSLFVSGLIKNADIYHEFRKMRIEHSNLNAAVKAASTNAQDDFRLEAYGVLMDYSSKQLSESLFMSEKKVLENEKREILKRIEEKIGTEGVQAFLKRKRNGKNGIRGRGSAMSKLRERLYFYAAGTHYHKTKDCKEFETSESGERFSIMEEAAKKGYFPCEHCMMGIR